MDAKLIIYTRINDSMKGINYAQTNRIHVD